MADQAENVSMQTRCPPVRSSVEVLPEDLAAPVWNRLVSWVILVPLLYLAGNGNPLAGWKRCLSRCRGFGHLVIT